MDAQGILFRSPAARLITLWDRLGGGDTWNAGFYYGLLTEGLGKEGIAKGVLVGDAATRLKQTLMFDLPIIDKAEVEALMGAELVVPRDVQVELPAHAIQLVWDADLADAFCFHGYDWARTWAVGCPGGWLSCS